LGIPTPTLGFIAGATPTKLEAAEARRDEARKEASEAAREGMESLGLQRTAHTLFDMTTIEEFVKWARESPYGELMERRKAGREALSAKQAKGRLREQLSRGPGGVQLEALDLEEASKRAEQALGRPLSPAEKRRLIQMLQEKEFAKLREGLEEEPGRGVKLFGEGSSASGEFGGKRKYRNWGQDVIIRGEGDGKKHGGAKGLIGAEAVEKAMKFCAEREKEALEGITRAYRETAEAFDKVWKAIKDTREKNRDAIEGATGSLVLP